MSDTKVALYDEFGVKVTPAKTLEKLERLEMQAIVDVEAVLVGMGIEFDMGCSRCNRHMHANTTLDVWTIECECTVWRYAGNDITPPDPPPPLHPRAPLEDDAKREEHISRLDMAKIQAFDGVMTRVIKGAYKLYCLRCKLAGDPCGISGRATTEENVWLAECRCTRRTFRDAANATATRTH